MCLHHFVSTVQKQSLSGGLASLGNWSAASAASKLMKKALKLEALTLSLLAVLTHSYVNPYFPLFSLPVQMCAGARIG